MSGLCADRRRVFSSFRQKARAPGMIVRWLAWAPGVLDPWGRRHARRTSGDRLKVERPPLVGDPHRPVHPFFHLHVRRPNRVVDLIEGKDRVRS